MTNWGAPNWLRTLDRNVSHFETWKHFHVASSLLSYRWGTLYHCSTCRALVSFASEDLVLIIWSHFKCSPNIHGYYYSLWLWPKLMNYRVRQLINLIICQNIMRYPAHTRKESDGHVWTGATATPIPRSLVDLLLKIFTIRSRFCTLSPYFTRLNYLANFIHPLDVNSSSPPVRS